MWFLACTSDKIFARPSVIPFRQTDDDDGDDAAAGEQGGWHGTGEGMMENSITVPLWPIHSVLHL